MATMRFQTIKFKAASGNSGVMTMQEGRGPVVTLHRHGKPLKGGDLVAGQTVTFNRATGEVVPNRELIVRSSFANPYHWSWHRYMYGTNVRYGRRY